MRVLVIGATGATGSRICAQLRRLGHEPRSASRHPASGSAAQIRFDWADPTTHDAALAGIDAIYMVPPVLVADPTEMMLPFIDWALDEGIRRFVLLSASAIEEGTPGVGTVHQALRERAPEWAVLRPSWFMQNFAGEHFHATSLREEGLIVTSTGSSRVGFVNADDIAAVAVRALTDPEPHNTAHVLTGPEALSYGDAAKIITEVAGRPIKHLNATPARVRERMIAAGVPQDFAEILTALEEVIVAGAEDRVTDTVERVTGRPPSTFLQFAHENRTVWRAARPSSQDPPTGRDEPAASTGRDRRRPAAR
jgi:ergot alkaloid biosynthesis protein